MWRPIETAPESTPIIVNAPKRHRGHDTCEVVVLYRNDDGCFSYWTNGGANAGESVEFDIKPTHWQPIPDVA